jgi:predicted phosphoadenosine phosphosulfate sulfurtransferase
MKNVEKELKALDELYNPRVTSFEDSVLHKTKAQMEGEKLKDQLKKDKNTTSFGRICFELNDLDYWMKKLSLERSYEPFYERPKGQFEFTDSFLKLKS